MSLTKLLFSGVHEVVRLGKGGGVSHVGYVDNVDVVLETFKNDLGYAAIYASLNPLPFLPEGFTLNQFRSAPHRSGKDWYTRRTAIMVDCDPVRSNGIAKSNSTDVEKAAAWDQLREVVGFLCEGLQWPEPVLLDSGNGYQARFAVDLQADQATEDLIRSLLCGLSAKLITTNVLWTRAYLMPAGSASYPTRGHGKGRRKKADRGACPEF